MATALENLIQTRANIAADLADLSDPARRKPTYSINGKSVSWGEYWKDRVAALKDINEAIANFQPYEFHSQALP